MWPWLRCALLLLPLLICSVALAQMPGVGIAEMQLEHRQAADILPALKRFYPEYRFRARGDRLFAPSEAVADRGLLELINALDTPPRPFQISLRLRTLISEPARGQRYRLPAPPRDQVSRTVSVMNGSTARISGGIALRTQRTAKGRFGRSVEETVLLSDATGMEINLVGQRNTFDANIQFRQQNLASDTGSRLYLRSADTRVQGNYGEWIVAAIWEDGGQTNSSTRTRRYSTTDTAQPVALEVRVVPSR
jgi:hypothetical protein